MESIIENIDRIGKLTSSEIWKLTKKAKDKINFGEKALTYIDEKKIETRLKRSLNKEVSTRDILWGRLMEQRVHELLPLKYESHSKLTLNHKTIKHWSGSPDNQIVSESVVCDTKCYQPKAFAKYVDVLSKNDIDLFRSENESEYWQLISNAILTDSKFIEAIVYMPYESELEEIRNMASNYDGEDQFKYRFIYESPKSELAYLPNDCYYKNLNIFRFEALDSDKQYLTELVEEAILLL